MVKVIVLERNAMLRTGIVQLLSQVLPDSTIEGHGYATLDQPPDETRQGGLVLLSVPSPERRDSLIQASERVYAPKGIVLMLEGEATPVSTQGLPSVVAGFIDKTAAPETFLADIRLILAGESSSALKPGQVRTSAPVPAEALAVKPARILMPVPRSPAAINVSPEAARVESSLLGLTPRQYEVLVLLARGDALKTIARHLNISVATTKAHTEGLYQRLDVHNRNAAVYAARARGAGLGWMPRQGSLELGHLMDAGAR